MSSKGVLAIAVVGAIASYYSLHNRIYLSNNAVSYSLPEPPELIGPLTPNDKLSNAKYILEGLVTGPESIYADGDILYTGLADGRLIKVVDGMIQKELRLSMDKNCGSYDKESSCGRPLGIRRLNGDIFIVADAYLGVFKVDFEKGTHERLISSNLPIDGLLPRFFNDIDILSSDEILISDSSTINQRRDFMKEILESKGTGRVLYHRISTGETRVLLNGLHFANGIQILPDRKSFLVAECTRARIIRYYLDGPKKGTNEIFIDNLPGLPDNIRLSHKGTTVWVGLAGLRRKGLRDLLESISDLPTIRNILVNILPNFILRDVFPRFVPKYAIVIEIDLNGNIVSSLHDTTGDTIGKVSQVTDGGKQLYLGSFNAPYIAVIEK